MGFTALQIKTVKLQPVYFIILGEMWLRSCFIRDFATGCTRSPRNGARQEWRGPHSTKTETGLGFGSSPVFHSWHCPKSPGCANC